MNKSDIQKLNLLIGNLVEPLGYQHYQPKRISYERYKAQPNLFNNYQGLSRAYHHNHGEVMLKWSLSDRGADLLESNHQCDLAREYRLIEALAEPEYTVRILDKHTAKLAWNNKPTQLVIMVMPYYPSGSIKDLMGAATLTDELRVELLLGCAKAIIKLHQAGWVHGDIKPSNFLIANAPSFFNLLTQTTNPHQRLQVVLNDLALSSRILPGASIHDMNNDALILPKGTPAYLAPECWQGQAQSVQSDIYAFGVMMFEVLAGYKPYQIKRDDLEKQERSLNHLEDKISQWATRHCQASIPKLPVPWQDYQPMIEKLLAKTTIKRYQQMDEVMIDLLAVFY